jgi:cytochrome c-type biogenesis protein CcmH/NrfG/outer membrane receptor protein involved in Fe transport
VKDVKTYFGVLVFFSAPLLSPVVFAQSPPATSPDNHSILLTVEGRVETARAGAPDWTPAQANQILHAGDQLRTGPRSRATVRLSNLTVLRVNELTTLQIQPPAAPGKQSSLNLKKGAGYFFSRERPAEMEFHTPIASGAIRGTEFNLTVADDGTTAVTLLDGEVALTNSSGGVSLVSGEEGVVEPGQAPRKTAVINAINTIQWCLYYPAVLDVDELNFSDAEKQALAASLDAYRAGDLPAAMANYPAGRTAVSDSEKNYLAGLLLSVGQVEQAGAQLGPIQSPQADALREVAAAAKFQIRPAILNPEFSTALLADSYYFQSRSQLDAALSAARAATEKSPNFGFAWERLAELEFSFGHTEAALAALEKSLQLSPRNAEALALKGFLLAAQNKIAGARKCFDDAIAADGALGNAWLGRGLVRLHQRDADGGLQDLQVAATLEPNRSLLRSYLGKAFANKHDGTRAEKELILARKLDPVDPTAWFYLALLDQQEDKVNDAVRDLEKSKELNGNRGVFRSRLLLDQDQAVRSANLARIYQDAGMNDVSVNEASRAVSDDYANYSAHQFLANSYDALRDPNQINLRYETPWFSELLLSELLAPVGADNLSQYISQQEYSRLFAQDHFGASSSTEYRSDGAWHEESSQYGNAGNFGYSFDADYRSQNGDRPNNDLEQTTYDIKAKEQLTPKDSMLLEAQIYDSSFGDVAQYYNQNGSIAGAPAPSLTFRGNETEQPNLFIGYHHEWNPDSHTLFLGGRLNDTLSYNDPNAQVLFYHYETFTRIPFSVSPLPFPISYQRNFNAYSAELQQIWEGHGHTLIAGARYQTGWADTTSDVNDIYSGTPMQQEFNTDLQRISVYGYDQWQVFDSLLLVGGVSYDRVRYPDDIDTAPITGTESDIGRVSPKAGFIWSPLSDTHLRGAYTRSLGGVFYDQSVRLEPTEVAGFNQAFRSMIPESIVGLVPGTRFETWGVGLDQAFKKTGTYLTIEGDILNSRAARTIGVITNAFFPVPDSPGNTRESLDFRERSLTIALNQLAGQDWSFGARYKLGDARLDQQATDIPTTYTGVNAINQNNQATLQQLDLSASFNHPSGFFSRFDALWSRQDNRGYSPDEPGDDFWQFNAYAGYRFHHRQAELQLGLLNITGGNYQLNPLNLYNELPRDRVLSVLCKFYF